MPCYKYTIASNPYKVCATVHSLQHMLPSIYMMPIPLTPPDDEVCIGIQNLCYHPQRATYIIFNVMAHLPYFNIRLCHLMTMST